MTRALTLMIVMLLAPVPGFLERWIPSIIPPEWADIQPVEWEPPRWSDTPLRLGDPAEPLEPAAARGFLTERIRNDSVGIQARFLLTPGASEHNSATLGHVRDTVGEQASLSGEKYIPEAHPAAEDLSERGCVRGSTYMPLSELLRRPEIAPPQGEGSAITCDVMAATGSLLVQRVRTIRTGDDPSDRVVTLITDTVHNSTVTGARLWNDDARQHLWNGVVALLRHEERSMSLMPAQSEPDDGPLNELLSSALPLPDGTVQVTVPAGFTAPELEALGIDPLEEPKTVMLGPQDGTEYLSEAGRAMLAALHEPVAFEDPPFVLAGHRDIDCSLFPCVALTYDDGPSELTPLVLDALDAHDAAASFFLVGQHVEHFADTARRTVNEGHLALNHSWSHADLRKLEEEGRASEDTDAEAPPDVDPADEKPSEQERHAAVTEELVRTSDVIAKVTGERPQAFRPPYGSVNETVLQLANLPAILWDLDTEDWKGVSEEELVSRVVTGAEPGSVVLQHDIHENTAHTVDRVMTGLEQRGFSLVNLQQLFGEMPTSGKWFSAR